MAGSCPRRAWCSARRDQAIAFIIADPGNPAAHKLPSFPRKRESTFCISTKVNMDFRLRGNDDKYLQASGRIDSP